MPRDLSPEAFRQMFSQEADDVFVICITLEHESLTAPIRLARNAKALERAAGTYLPCFFDFNLPEDNPDQPPQVQLSIDNVSGEIGRTIRSLPGRVKVTMEVVLASQPNVIEVGPHVFYLLTASYDAKKIGGILGFEDDILNQAFPAQTYNPENTPGLYR